MKTVALVTGGFLALVFGGYPALPSQPHDVGSIAEIVPGAVITQRFGCTAFLLEPVDPSCAQGHFHGGLDLAAREGTPVLAATAGRVEVRRSDFGYGLHVLVQADPTMLVLYGHLSRAAVESGELVVSGRQLGWVGSTGLSTGPHLHLEIRRSGRPVDPEAWLGPANNSRR